MLSNASCERGFSKQNGIMGSRSTRMETETLSVRMRISFDVPALSFDAAGALVATIMEDYWSGFTAMPARAAGAAACHTVRREKGAAAAVEKRKAKEARIGGSSNEQLDDGSKELTARVEFSSEKYQVKPQQPVTVDGSLNGGMMAKLMIETEGETRTEKWEVGRLKSAKKISVALPQGGTTVAAFLFTWQALDAAGRVSGDMLTDLSLDLAGCGPKSEWVMVEPKHVQLNKSRAGRPKKKARAK